MASLSFAIVKLGDWGWASPGVQASFATAAVSIGLFVRHCLRSSNPFVDPKLFRIREFSGASIAMALFQISFGGMLLSIVLWEQSVWGRSALQIGLSIAIGPLLVPFTSLLFSRRLIERFGAATVMAAGIVCFACGLACWALTMAPEASHLPLMAGMALLGIGTGLVAPTMMGVGTASLPPAAFATGAGVINMIRQAGLAIGVAMLVAIIGAPASMAERVAAFQRSWWVMAALVLLCLLPTLTLVRRR